MKLLKRYLKDRRRALLCALTLFAVCAFLLFLYAFSIEDFCYLSAVLAAVFLLFFIFPDFVSYRKKAQALSLLKEHPLQSSLPLSFSPSLPEELLLHALEELSQAQRELSAGVQKDREDLMDYYALWVHQIKTPLTAMRLILQSKPEAESEALLQELFRVERYLEMLLGYLRLGSFHQDLRLERCELRMLVSEAVKKFAPVFLYQDIRLELAPFRKEVITDRKWMVFVLEQLISNALKYTKEGSLSIRLEEESTLVLEDTGIGILPEDLPRIFERGFTGFQGRKEKSSTGLGLYLAKQVLDRLRTPIKITSVPGKGTVVRLFLGREDLEHY